MQFCIPLAFNPTEQWGALAAAAEEAGFAGLIVSDHLVYPEPLQTPYPYTVDGKPPWEPTTDWPDPLVAIGALSPVTARIRFITSIYILTLRHPVAAAKLIASADVFSKGRVTLGIGPGWMREEFELLGESFEGRGTRMEEEVQILRKLWSGGVVEHHGRHYDFDGLQSYPLPVGPVPMWGGGMSDVALRRAARMLDGWVSQILSTAEVRELVPRLLAHRRDSERADRPFEVCCAVQDAFTLDSYAELGELGVTHMITVPWMLYGGSRDPDVEQKCAALRRFGDEVIRRQ